MDTRQFYNDNGYYLARKLIAASDIDEVRRQSDVVFALQAKQFGIQSVCDQLIFELAQANWDLYVSCAQVCHQVPALHRIGVCNAMLNQIKILGVVTTNINMKPVLFFSSQQLAKHRFYWRSDPHQDYSGMKGSLNGIVAWAPVAPLTEEMGYLQVLPSSHKQGLVKHEPSGPSYRATEKTDGNWVSIPMEVGDVLFFSDLHASSFWKQHFR